MTVDVISAVTALGTLFAALAAAAAVWVSWRGIEKQNAQAQASREDFKLSLAADLSMKLDDRFNDEDFLRTRSDAPRVLLTKEKLANAEDVFDFFETVVLMFHTGALTNGLAYNFFF